MLVSEELLVIVLGDTENIYGTGKVYSNHAISISQLNQLILKTNYYNIKET